MASLAEIRAKLQVQENRNKDNGGPRGDGAMFPHWNMPDNSTSVLRMLPDLDPSNSFFWVEKAVIKLPFNGIKGGDPKQTIVQVPCMEMWGDACPILAEVRPWFKDKSLEDMGRKYWKKRSYLFQGFVRESSLAEETVPENPIRRFIFSPSIFDIVKASLLDPELENLPTDYTHGIDLRVSKTTKGGFANYDTTSWSRRETPLSDAELEAIEKYGLSDLKAFLPKKPSSIELSVMSEMFEASVDGKQYDPERWAQYFRPYGVPAPESTTSAPATPAPAAEAPKASAPWEADAAAAAKSLEKAEPTPTPAGGDKAAEILAMIRSRQAKA